MLTALSLQRASILRSVHSTQQMASLWGAQWSPASGLAPLVAVSRRRRKTDRMTMMIDRQSLAGSISARHWPGANTVSPFGSRCRKYGVGGRSMRGVGRPSMWWGIEFSLSWLPNFLSVLYCASGSFPGSGVTLAYAEDSAPTLCMIQWPTLVPFLFHGQFIQACFRLHTTPMISPSGDPTPGLPCRILIYSTMGCGRTCVIAFFRSGRAGMQTTTTTTTHDVDNERHRCCILGVYY